MPLQHLFENWPPQLLTVSVRAYNEPVATVQVDLAPEDSEPVSVSHGGSCGCDGSREVRPSHGNRVVNVQVVEVCCRVLGGGTVDSFSPRVTRKQFDRQEIKVRI